MPPFKPSRLVVLSSIALLASLSLESIKAEKFLPRQHVATSDLSASLKHKISSPFKDSPPLVDAVQSLPLRGGGADTPTKQQITGVVAFTLIEVAIRKAFKANGITFPAQLAGCVFLFVFLILAQIVSPGLGDSICNSLSPGAGFLAKWMGVFFVPGLTMLPLAPSLGSSLEIVKVLGVVVMGFYYSLFLVTYAVLGVRTMLGSISTTTSPVGPKRFGRPAAVAAPTKPYEESTLKFLLTGTVVFGISWAAMEKFSTNVAVATSCQTLFFACVTLGSYVWGANLPSSITKVFNPLLTSAAAVLLTAKLLPTVTGSANSFTDILRSYTCKKLAIGQAGAGDLLLFMLSPSVISFAVGMYKGKGLIANNLPAILTAVLTGSVGSMFGTAAFCRLIQLGGTYGQVIRLAAVPRSTQTALGMTIAGMLGGDVAIAATIIILTGIFGGMMGVKTLDAWGVKDSVSRGLGIGSAGLSLGVVSIKSEPEAFAFAGLCLVLTAVSATSMASIPAIKDLLIRIAGGAP